MSAHVVEKTLYKPDCDRRANLHELEAYEYSATFCSRVREQAQSVACLMLDTFLVQDGEQHFKLSPFCQTLGQEQRLKAEEKFFDEPSPGFGTAFLVDKDVLLTASHCITGKNLSDVKVVFGFEITKDKVIRMAASSIYGIRSVIANVYRSDESCFTDWALVQLDRKVTDRKPLKLAQSVATKQAVYMLGHPSGLTVKLAGGATVKRSDHPGYFEANLDAFQGNSGSPVFDKTSGKVIGILVRGRKDFAYSTGGWVTHHCSSMDAKLHGYEKCQRIVDRVWWGREPGQGINLRASCKNDACADKGTKVYLRPGTGSFNWSELNYALACSTCKEYIPSVDKVKLMRCRVAYSGRYREDTARVPYEGENVIAGTTRAASLEGDLVSRRWIFLRLTITPRD